MTVSWELANGCVCGWYYLKAKGNERNIFVVVVVVFNNRLYFLKAVLVEWKVEISHSVSNNRVVYLLEFMNLYQHITTTQKSPWCSLGFIS